MDKEGMKVAAAMRRRRGEGDSHSQKQAERCKPSTSQGDASHEARQMKRTEAPSGLGAQEEQAHRAASDGHVLPYVGEMTLASLSAVLSSIEGQVPAQKSMWTKQTLAFGAPLTL